jgi:patatin-like phospholipase/acyl hydrolase
MMKKILQIDGGGIRGIIPATVLAQLEIQLGQPLYHYFDLITSTSTGAIIGGAIAAGVPAKDVAHLYVKEGKRLFTPRSWRNPKKRLQEKYDRKPFLEEIRKTLEANQISSQLKLCELKKPFMATAFNLNSQRTHFIKSWDKKDQNFDLIEVISWSALSAVYYFGKINAPNYQWCDYHPDIQRYYENCQYKLGDSVETSVQKQGAVFQDGGQGAHNSTLGYALVESLARGWMQDGIFLLSLGTGNPERHKVDCSKLYLACLFGFTEGLARQESIIDQVLAAIHLSDVNPMAKLEPSFKFKRLDVTIKFKEYQLDNVKCIPQYQEYAQKLCQPEKLNEIVKMLQA